VLLEVAHCSECHMSQSNLFLILASGPVIKSLRSSLRASSGDLSIVCMYDLSY